MNAGFFNVQNLPQGLFAGFGDVSGSDSSTFESPFLGGDEACFLATFMSIAGGKVLPSMESACLLSIPPALDNARVEKDFSGPSGSIAQEEPALTGKQDKLLAAYFGQKVSGTGISDNPACENTLLNPGDQENGKTWGEDLPAVNTGGGKGEKGEGIAEGVTVNPEVFAQSTDRTGEKIFSEEANPGINQKEIKWGNDLTTAVTGGGKGEEGKGIVKGVTGNPKISTQSTDRAGEKLFSEVANPGISQKEIKWSSDMLTVAAGGGNGEKGEGIAKGVTVNPEVFVRTTEQIAVHEKDLSSKLGVEAKDIEKSDWSPVSDEKISDLSPKIVFEPNNGSNKILNSFNASTTKETQKIGIDNGSNDFLFSNNQPPSKQIDAVLALDEPNAADKPFQREVVSQIVEKAVLKLKAGESEVKIDLKPELLGHLKLRITTDNQQVMVRIVAEMSTAKAIIENNVIHLKTALQSHGLEIDTFDVSLAPDSDRNNDRHESPALAGMMEESDARKTTQLTRKRMSRWFRQ